MEKSAATEAGGGDSKQIKRERERERETHTQNDTDKVQKWECVKASKKGRHANIEGVNSIRGTRLLQVSARSAWRASNGFQHEAGPLQVTAQTTKTNTQMESLTSRSGQQVR